ncbi:MAG: ABC transporter permease [bacterium]|nr:ABC transporter permease [bacterium]
MGTYILRRCLQALIVLKGVLVITFLMLHITGDPAEVLLPEDADEQQIIELREKMGLNDPLLKQYGRFFVSALKFEFGESFRQGEPAMKLVLAHVPATAELALTAIVIALLISIPAGVISATQRNSIWDRISMLGALLGQSMPNFWLGLILLLVISLWLDLLPSHGRGTIAHLILPAVTAGLYATGRITRVLRSGMLEVLGQDYVRTARSKGLSETLVVYRHALKNAAIPVVTVIGLELGLVLGGTVVTEIIFAWPGVGRLTVNAILNDDFPIVQAAVFFLAFIFIFINLIVDVLYAWLDPRIKYS